MKEKEFDNLIKARLKNHESPIPAGMWERIAVSVTKRRGGFTPRLYLLLVLFLLIGFVGIFYSPAIHDQTKKEIVSNNKSNNNNNRDETNLVQSKNKREGSTSNLNLPNFRFRPSGSATATSRKQQGGDNSVTNTTNKKKKNSYDSQKVFNRSDVVDGNGNDKVATGVSTDNASHSPDKRPVKETANTKQDEATEPEINPSPYETDKFSLELFTSPAVPINSISSDNTAYEHALKAASNMQLSYTIGARISYSISKKFSAKAGVQYSLVNEKINFKDSAGNNYTSNNRYKNIGIPLVIGYRIVSANNLDVFLTTGIILNVVSTYKGIIPSSGTGQPIDIKNENVYNTNASANFYFAINLSKKMNSRTDFFAEPWINYHFKNMVSHYYPFDQKINTLGLSLGLRYRLFKNEPPR